MTTERRIVYDYYYEQQFIFRIGYVHHLAAIQPLEIHDHDNMTEFVYMERGSQNYQTTNKQYVVNPGEVFFTRPRELHSTGSFPEEVSSLYYFIVDLSLIPNLNLFLFPEEYEQIRGFFSRTSDRIFKASENLPSTLKALLKCFSGMDLHFDSHVRNALSEVLIALATPAQSKNTSHVFHIQKSLAYIEEHLEETIAVSDLPSLDSLSLSTFNKYFVHAMGLPPGEYILRKKIEKAKELLSATDLSVTEIAYKYGFSSSQYFSTVFKRFCYVTPTEYRKKSTPPQS